MYLVETAREGHRADTGIPLIHCYRFIISIRINFIFIHSETSRIAQTRMTHLFKESEIRRVSTESNKQADVDTRILTSLSISNIFFY